MKKILKSLEHNFVEIDVEIKHSTDLAILIFDGDVTKWVPKCLLKDDPEELNNGMVRIIIPEKFAQEKKLI